MSQLKKRLVALLILIGFLLTTLSILSMHPKNAYAIQNSTWTLSDCYEVTDFIRDNFETFVSEYNKTTTTEGELLSATSIENERIIYLIEDENYGVYLDFNDNNGYAVITGTYTIYALEVTGDLQNLNAIDELYYSYLDGFCTLNSNGTYSVIYPKTTFENNIEPDYSADYYSDHATIKDLDGYISDKYSDYTYYNNILRDYEPNINYHTQLSTSYYVWSPLDANQNHLSYGLWTEGNCALTAMTNILTFWGNESLTNIEYLTATDFISNDLIKNDTYYNTYANNKIYPNPFYNSSQPITSSNAPYAIWNINQDSLYNMSMLYQDVRNYCIEHYNYSPISGFQASNVPDVLEYIVESFDYANKTEIDVQPTTSASDVGNAMLKGRASYVSIQNHPIYESHGAAIVDMYIYSYKEGWWIFATEKHAYFYEIVDGWEKDTTTNGLEDTGLRYLDPNANDGTSLQFYVWI